MYRFTDAPCSQQWSSSHGILSVALSKVTVFEAVPAAHATDSHGKHRKNYSAYYESKFLELHWRVPSSCCPSRSRWRCQCRYKAARSGTRPCFQQGPPRPVVHQGQAARGRVGVLNRCSVRESSTCIGASAAVRAVCRLDLDHEGVKVFFRQTRLAHDRFR